MPRLPVRPWPPDPSQIASTKPGAVQFLKNGVLDTSLFSDPQQVPSEPALHPSPEGQERMAAALEPT